MEHNNNCNNECNNDTKRNDATKEPKLKNTYYLDSATNKKFTDVYINRLHSNKKIDRSALICEAIEHLYKIEFLMRSISFLDLRFDSRKRLIGERTKNYTELTELMESEAFELPTELMQSHISELLESKKNIDNEPAESRNERQLRSQKILEEVKSKFNLEFNIPLFHELLALFISKAKELKSNIIIYDVDAESGILMDLDNFFCKDFMEENGWDEDSNTSYELNLICSLKEMAIRGIIKGVSEKICNEDKDFNGNRVCTNFCPAEYEQFHERYRIILNPAILEQFK